MAGAVHAEKQRKDELELAEAAAPIARTPTLTVGHAFDPAEAEADRVADSVIARLRESDDLDHGDHDHADHDHSDAGYDDVHRVATRSADPVVGMAGGELPARVSSQIEAERGRGQRLSGPVRRRMEGAFGRDLGNVSIHTDERAATLSSSISAHAFTTGNDIFFGAGQFRPDTGSGERMLAHELAHTVQQSDGIGRSTIHRKWNLKSKGPLPWGNTGNVRTLKAKPVWFFVDKNDQDEMVVKIENQPIGVGDIVASMQKKITKVKSVDQRKLDGNDRKAIGLEIQTAVAKGEDSWLKRGQDLVAGRPDAPTDQLEIRQQAEADALKDLMAPTNNVMAMSLASGDKAEDLAEQPHKDGNNKMRAILDVPGHAKLLGVMTAVDLFVGNEDRVYAGNLGNWFYSSAEPNLTNAVTLIDQVGPGLASAFAGNTWLRENDMKDSNLPKTAKECVRQISFGMERANDNTVQAWLDAPEGAKTRRDRLTEEMLQGLIEGKKKIIKIFSTTKFDLLKRKDHKVKKEFKASAKAATALDQNDPTKYSGGAAPDYWVELKRRATRMKS